MDTQELQRVKNKYNIIGNNPLLNRALETAVAVAPTDISVLITGESGVGKETIPQIIHQHSRRKTGRYVAVNCGGIPEGTINSELFGHEKGAFTGAIGERKGYFEEADGGTIFLDEVGELPLSTQAMLLRVLQNGEYMKVGSSKVEKTDVRVVAATNVNLLHAVSKGKFREDLYYRLNAIQIQMPSLRDRKDDIYLLFRKFSSDFSEKYNVTKIALSHDAISMLQNYRWPGNIRQLKNVAETVSALESEELTAMSGRKEIDAETLYRYMPHEADTLIPAAVESGQNGSAMSSDEKQIIIKAILDLKQEVEALKQMVYGKGTPKAALPAPEQAVTLPHEEEAEWQGEGAPEQAAAASVQNITAQASESLSIKEASVELIEKALAKHGGNRKAAADELGISERTLYRRLRKSDR